MQMPTFHPCAALSSAGAPLSRCHIFNICAAQGAIVFQRVRHRILNIQTVVKPNNEWRRNPLHNATQGATVSVSGQKLWGDFYQKLRAAGEASLIVRHNIREIQMADEAVKSLGRWRQRSQLLHHVLLVLVKGISRGLFVCLSHFTHRIGRDGGFCFDICFFSWVRIKLGRVIRGQRV